MAAPIATASSGLTSFLLLSRKIFNFLLNQWHAGLSANQNHIINVFYCLPASSKAVRQGTIVLLTNSSTNDSNFALDNFITKCFGPDWSAVIYGRLISVCWLVDSSILAFSAASFSLCKANGSFCRSTPLSALNSSAR